MLELRNIYKTFNLTSRKEDERVALDNLSLKIADGEFVTIIGGNGSGKSTTMNIITGSIKPDSGSVLINRVDITKETDYQRAAYFGRVFQDPMMGTSGDMSVIENMEIAYQRGLHHSPITWGFRKDHKYLFKQELRRLGLGLEDRLYQKVGVMSGGQRQALTLLMATIRNKTTPSLIRKMYIKFANDGDKINNKKEFDGFHQSLINQFVAFKKELKNDKTLTKKEAKVLLKNKKFEIDAEIREKFDISKQILLLDEHTAALDPKTAKKVLDLTETIVKEKKMTTLMITHNLKDAITYGDRLIMFHHGKIILDCRGKEKQSLTVEKLLEKFEQADALLQ